MAVAVAHQALLDPADEAEQIILDLCAVLLGDKRDPKKRDNGLLSRLQGGRQHPPTCMSGMWVAAGDSLRGGQPCSDRCVAAHEALDAAGRWLRAREGR